MKIVIAEDGPEHARILLAVLKRTGYELVFVEDGTAAYEYLAKNEMPDLLITDILMPGMSGFELMARLKAEGKLPPTLILTSKQREEDVLRGLELGALDYVTKPFSPSVILAKVKGALARKAA
jgi:two-component system copper resistance phosphate regulon response regulator CusR